MPRTLRKLQCAGPAAAAGSCVTTVRGCSMRVASSEGLSVFHSETMVSKNSTSNLVSAVRQAIPLAAPRAEESEAMPSQQLPMRSFR